MGNPHRGDEARMIVYNISPGAVFSFLRRKRAEESVSKKSFSISSFTPINYESFF
jgi:hypothetical protein